MQLNTLQHRIRRRGLEWAVVVVGIVLAIGTGEPGNAVMLAALAYIVGSAFQELWRHRWFGINAALVAVSVVLATGPAAVLATGGDTSYWAAPLVALAVLVMGYVVWLVVGLPWQPSCCCRRYRCRGQRRTVAAATAGVAAWAYDGLDENDDSESRATTSSVWSDRQDDVVWQDVGCGSIYHPSIYDTSLSRD